MNKDERLHTKYLNKMVTSDKFIDGEDGKVLYSSISQPPLKVIDTKDTDDCFKWIVECPTCGTHVLYGTEIFMLNGYEYCVKEGCREKVLAQLNIKGDD